MMFKRIPTQIGLVSFPNEGAANAAAEELAKNLVGEPIVCTNLAVVSKTKSKVVKVAEYGRNGPLNGFVGGGMTGTVIGGIVGGLALCLLGPIGIAIGGTAGALIGAAVGAVNGTVIGTVKGLTVESMDKKNLNVLSDCLEPETSVLVAFFGEVVVKRSDYQKLYKENKDGLDSLLTMIGLGIRSALRQQKIFGVAVTVDEEGVAASRTLIGEGSIDLSALLLTPEGGMVPEASLNNEGEGTVTGLVASKDEGIFAGGALVKEDALVYEVAVAQKNNQDEMELNHEIGAVVTPSAADGTADEGIEVGLDSVVVLAAEAVVVGCSVNRKDEHKKVEIQQ